MIKPENLNEFFTTPTTNLKGKERLDKIELMITKIKEVIFKDFPVQLELDRSDPKFYCLIFEGQKLNFDSLSSLGEALRMIHLIFCKDIVEGVKARRKNNEPTKEETGTKVTQD